jgi:hypothetical protein
VQKKDENKAHDLDLNYLFKVVISDARSLGTASFPRVLFRYIMFSII